MGIGDVVIITEPQTSAPASCVGCIGVITDMLYYESTPWVLFKSLDGTEAKYCFSDSEVSVIGNINNIKEKKPCSCSIQDLLKTGCICQSITRFVPKSVMS